MPEKIRNELDKGETRSKNTLQKIRKLPGKILIGVHEKYTELRSDGRKLVKQIDNRLDKAEDQTKDAFMSLRKRFKKIVTQLTDAWEETGEEPIIEYYE